MKKSTLLKKCDSYLKLFSNDSNITRSNILEYMDFANKHLPTHSNLAFQINELKGTESFTEHVRRVKDFIETNGSESMNKTKNFLSELNSAALYGIILTFSTIVFGVGYYFGTEKINTELIRTENELNKLKDSLSLIKVPHTNKSEE